MTTSSKLGPAGSFTSYFLKSIITARTPPSHNCLDLTGQTAIITGGYTGLGYECGRILLSQKLSHLVITVRNEEKGNEAASKLQALYPNARIDVWLLDMLEYHSIQTFVKQCSKLPRLDLVILNAGMVAGTFRINEKTNHEEAFSVNYLSTALLTLLLLPVLKAAAKKAQSPHVNIHLEPKPSRLTLIGSGLALAASFPELERNESESTLFPAFDDPKYFRYFERYSTTKLLLLFFVSKVADYINADEIIINVADPGYINHPGLDRELSAPGRIVGTAFRQLMGRSLNSGAWAYVDAALTKGKESHGGWVVNWVVHPFPKIMFTPEGKEAGIKLWEETLTELEWASVREILASMAKESTRS